MLGINDYKIMAAIGLFIFGFLVFALLPRMSNTKAKRVSLLARRAARRICCCMANKRSVIYILRVPRYRSRVTRKVGQDPPYEGA
jgi:hypothetical protein